MNIDIFDNDERFNAFVSGIPISEFKSGAELTGDGFDPIQYSDKGQAFYYVYSLRTFYPIHYMTTRNKTRVTKFAYILRANKGTATEFVLEAGKAVINLKTATTDTTRIPSRKKLLHTARRRLALKTRGNGRITAYVPRNAFSTFPFTRKNGIKAIAFRLLENITPTRTGKTSRVWEWAVDTRDDDKRARFARSIVEGLLGAIQFHASGVFTLRETHTTPDAVTSATSAMDGARAPTMAAAAAAGAGGGGARVTTAIARGAEEDNTAFANLYDTSIFSF